MPTQNKYRLIATLLLCLPHVSIASDNALPDDAVTIKEKFLQSSGYDSSSAVLPLKILLTNSNNIIRKWKNPNAIIYWKLLPERFRNRETDQVTCGNDDMFQSGRLTIKDILAVPLAELVYGKSMIIGECFGEENKECYIEITHANGEAVFSYEIRFKTQKNKLLMDSLRCVSIP
jgi:hypothetical protein